MCTRALVLWQKHGRWGKLVMEAVNDLFEEFSEAVAVVAGEARRK